MSDTPFPAHVVNGITLESGYDKKREARIQAQLIPANARQAWVYGLGTGVLAEELLNRALLEQLNVVLLNISLAAQILEQIPMPWLQDSRVRLLSGCSLRTLHGPFSALPGCLRLADDHCARLRDLIHLELSTPYIHRQHATNEQKVLAKRIQKNLKKFRQDENVANLFQTAKGGTFLIAGAGPTLDQHLDILRRLKDKAILIAVDAALIPLLNQNIYPEYTITVDPKSTVSTFFQTDLDIMRKQALVYFPTVEENVIQRWPGKRYRACPNRAPYAETCTQYGAAPLFSSGSVIHPATDLAVRMGAEKIIFFGADFSYPNSITHAADSPVSKKVTTSYTPHTVLNGHGNKVITTANLCGYLRDLETFIEQHSHIDWINTSLQGALIKGCRYFDHSLS